MNEHEKESEEIARGAREGSEPDSQVAPDQALALQGARATPWGPPITGPSLTVLREFAEKARQARAKDSKRSQMPIPRLGTPNTP